MKILEKAETAARGAWKDRARLAKTAQRYILAALIGELVLTVGLRISQERAATSQAPAQIVEASVVRTPADLWESEKAHADREEAELTREAEILARMLYGQCRWNSEDAQKAVCWLVINRVESSLFPDTVEDVIGQPSQWMGYSPDNPLTQQQFEIALSVLQAWRAGSMRPIGGDYLFMTWSYDAVDLRTTFNEGGTTRHWKIC